MMKMTVSVLKADVGSQGGHTRPSDAMLEKCHTLLRAAQKKKLIIDFTVTHTGDDIALTLSHTKGTGHKAVHALAWQCFKQATAIASSEGLYGAGQDLLVDAPSGNIRGAGPAVAEIEFPLLPDYRPAEALMVFAADKCGPGAYNLMLWNTFCNPLHNGGLLLSPKLAKGFIFTVIDMNFKGPGDRVIELRSDEPHAHLKLAALLRNPDRYAIEAVHSLAFPGEQIVSVSATRLHNIAGKYTGKDDPIMLFRTQGAFPAPEEAVSPFGITPYVTGDCRGSHTMTLMPVALNTAVRGIYCQPIVSSAAYSLNKSGRFSQTLLDVFAGVEWNEVRKKALEKSAMIREQGFIGVAMASEEEIAYTGLVEMMSALDKKFQVRK